ncbi:MAG: N-acetylmuramic acid 6-phosphate etherase [Ekhidna sp.]|nr:N-acetylmuramic acid 6-phosphate etherase [Ekhidna sp.]
MDKSKITEKFSDYDSIESMSTEELLFNINNEDAKVADAVGKAIPQIKKLVDQLHQDMLQGGHLFYIGAGTSGRLGILDASEIPPTFGVKNRIIGLIAGGDKAIRTAVEAAEDDRGLARKDLSKYNFSSKDALIGIAASGTTPYVMGGLQYAKSIGSTTGCITNNTRSPIAAIADCPIEVIVGPEFITGSTRMKSGTSQKLVLNMISTSLMIKAGRVKGNKMVNMQLNNDKLVKRGINFIIDELNISPEEASSLLSKYNSVQEAINFWQSEKSKPDG